MNMRNATCVGTETSKVPTRVTLLFIFYSVVQLQKRRNRAKKDLRARPNIFVENHYKYCSARFKQDLGQMQPYVPTYIPKFATNWVITYLYA